MIFFPSPAPAIVNALLFSEQFSQQNRRKDIKNSMHLYPTPCTTPSYSHPSPDELTLTHHKHPHSLLVWSNVHTVHNVIHYIFCGFRLVPNYGVVHKSPLKVLCALSIHLFSLASNLGNPSSFLLCL